MPRMAIPSVEPTAIIAGDTLAWTKSLADYPASAAWVLKYRLINAASKIDITATTSGADHLVSVAAAVTALYPVGLYTYQIGRASCRDRV